MEMGEATEEAANVIGHWVPSPMARVGSAVLVLGAACGIGLDAYLVQDGAFVDLAVPVLVALLGWWLFALRPYLTLTSTTVVVQNPLRRRVLGLRELEEVDVLYSGIRLRRSEGRSVTAWAVQKWNLSRMIGRISRADHVVERIRTQAELQRSRGWM